MEGPSAGGERALARRALLRLAAYAVPALVGTFAVTRAAAAQSCIPVGACNPDRCAPTFGCKPDVPCKPIFGCKPSTK